MKTSKPFEQVQSKEGTKNLPKPQFISSNFDVFYDSFHQPLANAIPNNGELIGISKDGELKRFEHTEVSVKVERDLAQHAAAKDSSMLEAKLASYFQAHKDEVTESLNYILSFYKVLQRSH
eukprot:TRINITY_DN2359_c0_g3_i1.p2 TRINITY_DN2359_c0_g3~~TRINITY_DN2359_c0_g3_i1.p2  ORF type:complete len:121 (-),score=29.73 TRINITY_DN2359_c0_g3_i1:703-1065(-)